MVLAGWVSVLSLATSAAVGATPADSSAAAPASVTRGAPPERPPNGDDERPPTYLRAAIETMALLGLGTTWYWTRVSSQKDGWDINFDWRSWRRKIDLDAVRFDDNLYVTNAFSHPISGTMYYNAARSNGLGLFRSYLSAFMASTFWEYMIEFHELPSLNDIIMTPAGGTAIGEPLYRLSRSFAAGPRTLAHRIGAWLFSPISSLNDLMDGKHAPPVTPPSEERLWMELGVASASLEGNAHRNEASLSLGSALVFQPQYRRPGQGVASVAPGSWTSIELQLRADRSAVRGGELHAGTIFLGRYLRSYGEGPHGAGLLLGLGGNFDADVRSMPAGWDRVTSVGLLGPSAELTVDQGWFHLRLWLSSTYAFALLQSLALARFGDELAAQPMKASLRAGGYYYAQGLTSRGGLRLQVGPVAVALAGDLGLYRSLQGRDRFQERLHHDFLLTDVRAGWSASMSVPVGRGVRISAIVDRFRWHSRLLDRGAGGGELRTGLAATVTF